MIAKTWKIPDFINLVTIKRYQDLVSSKLDINTLRNAHNPRNGDHLLFFHPVTTNLSRDGYYDYQTPHVLIGEPISFERRMWVQGSISFLKPLKCAWYQCQENLKFIKRIGDDYFVALNRVITDSDNEVYVEELRTLIYTNQTVFEGKVQQSKVYKNFHRFHVEDIDLFIYSSLSSNPHRIHWDRDYARNVEGYKDIIVQGPFIVQLVLNYFESKYNINVENIKYKNIAHIYQGSELEICDNGITENGTAELVIRNTQNNKKVYFEATLTVGN